MTKLNPKGKNTRADIRKVAAKRDEKLGFSKNGNLQFKKEPLQHLYELTVSTLFGKDTFYRTSNQLVKDMKKELNAAVDMGAYDFIANVAVHARTVMNIRTMPVVLVVEFAKALSKKRQKFLDEIATIRGTRTPGLGTNLTNEQHARIAELQVAADAVSYAHMRQLVCDVIQRADQITDLYAYALEAFGDKKKIPMAIKRGVGDAFNKFNGYHFAKYNRSGEVKFRDVLRIVHPEAKSKAQGFVFEQIMKETLETPYTWETELTKNGQLPEAERKSKKVIWTELLVSGKLGYMALLRNLRNIIEAGVDNETLKTHVCDVLADPKRIALSKQFPFAFVQANLAIADIAPQGVKKALAEALEQSCKNIPQLGDNVVLMVDASGSMQNNWGDSNHKPGWYPADQASVLAAALAKANKDAFNLTVIYFHSSAHVETVNTSDSVMTISQHLRARSTGGTTNLAAAFNLMKSKNIKPDAVIVLSDMEVDRCGAYERPDYVFHNNKCVKVAVNLNGSNTTPLSSKDGWYQLAGWSDKMFKFIPAMRESVSVVDVMTQPYIGLEAMKAELVAETEE